MLKMGNARKEGGLVVRATDMDVGKLDLVDSGTTPVTCTVFHHMTLPSVWTSNFYCYKGFWK